MTPTQGDLIVREKGPRTPVLIRRSYGEPGYLKHGPYHLVGQEQLPTLAQYRAHLVVRTWCGTKLRLGPSEILPGRDATRDWAPGALVAKLCRRCFHVRK